MFRHEESFDSDIDDPNSNSGTSFDEVSEGSAERDANIVVENYIERDEQVQDTASENDVLFDDIGKLLDRNGKLEHSKLTDSIKYNLLKHHCCPPRDFKFPSSKFGKRMRKACHSQIKDTYVYSIVDDSIWCVCCAMFAENGKQNWYESLSIQDLEIGKG